MKNLENWELFGHMQIFLGLKTIFEKQYFFKKCCFYKDLGILKQTKVNFSRNNLIFDFFFTFKVNFNPNLVVSFLDIFLDFYRFLFCKAVTSNLANTLMRIYSFSKILFKHLAKAWARNSNFDQICLMLCFQV